MNGQNIKQLEARISALEELLSVSESSFFEEAKKLEKANEALRESIEKHKKLESDIRQILDASSDAIRVIDKDFNIIYASKSFLELKDIKEDVIGRKCYEVDLAKECFTEECSLKRLLKTGNKFEEEVVFLSKEGVETPYLVTVSPYIDSGGELIGMVKTYKNIVDEKKARYIAEENAQQQGRIEMANNILHDIGNALTGVNTYALKPQMHKDWPEIKSLQNLKSLFLSREKELRDILGAEKGDALLDLMDPLIAAFEQRNASTIEFFQKITKAVGHVSSVLELQRHYMRENSAQFSSDININALIQDSFTMLASSLEKRKIHSEINSFGKVLFVSGDQTRLVRVFLNIIRNIYQAIDALDVESEQRILEVKIRPDEKHEIVEILFLDNAACFSAKEFELALDECRNIVESHGGTVLFESDKGKTDAGILVRLPLNAIKSA